MNKWEFKTIEYEKDIIPHNGNKFLIGNGYYVSGVLWRNIEKKICPVLIFAGIYD